MADEIAKFICWPGCSCCMPWPMWAGRWPSTSVLVVPWSSPPAGGKVKGDFWTSTMWREFSQHYDMDKIEAKRGSVGANLDL